MAIAYVQDASNKSSTGTTVAVTIAAPQAGSLLVCHVTSAAPHVTSIAGGGVTAWINISSTGNHTINEIWYGLNASGSGTTITITMNATNNDTICRVVEFSGIVSVGALDKSGTNNGTASPALSNSVSPVQSDELLFAGLGQSPNAVTGNPASFTNLVEIAGTLRLMDTSYRIVSAVGSYSASWTLGATNGWDNALVSFKGIVTVPDDDDLMSYPAAPLGGRDWPTPDSAKQFEEMTSWTNVPVLPVRSGVFGIAPPYGVELDTAQAHDLLGGSWQTSPPARQIEEMTNWTNRVILPLQNFDWDRANDPARNIIGWLQPEDEADWANDVFAVIPPFDPTQINWPEQMDIPSPVGMRLEENDNTLQIFIPVVAYDHDADPQMPTPALASSLLDPDDRTIRIFIPTVAYDHDGDGQRPTPGTTRDDSSDNTLRIFLPANVWDDDWQMATQLMAKLEETDSPLILFLPPFDPALVRDGEQVQWLWPATVKLDDERDYQVRIFLPLTGWDDDWQMLAMSTPRLEEVDSPLQLFLPPFDPVIVREGDFIPLAPPSARLSVEPEGEWIELIVISITPPPAPPAVAFNRFRIYNGVRITRGF